MTNPSPKDSSAKQTTPILEDDAIEYSAEAACGAATDEQLHNFYLGYLQGSKFARDLYEFHLALHTQELTENPMMVVHVDGTDTIMHPAEKVCKKCCPPIEITDTMVKRAIEAFHQPTKVAYTVEPGKSFTVNPMVGPMRAALEAALDG
jgi:hypothetical protein